MERGVTKIVYNSCYGGFELSKAAVDLYWEFKGEPKPLNWDYDLLSRDDPILVQVVEEMGPKKASGNAARLRIHELPEGTLYRIDEYDGMENVMTQYDLLSGYDPILERLDEYEWSIA